MSTKAFGSCLALLVLFMAGSTALAQTYITDEACAFCHPGKYDSYLTTGHPWMLYDTDRQQPAADTYPWGVPLPELPDGVQWSDVDYIQGNFSSGHGYVIGTDADGVPGMNLNRGFPYSNCVKCHVTGYDPEGGETDGITGTWSQPGIRCEACHSPSGPHLDDSTEGALECIDCHYAGDDADRIDFELPDEGEEGFGVFGHHPQGELFAHSAHKKGHCADCHDPHRSTWFMDGGVKRHCTDCHDEDEHQVPAAMAGLDCIDCHMPLVSGGGGGAAHLFRIMDEPVSAAENVYEEDGETFWNEDENGNAALTLDLVCLGCHSEQGPAHAMTLEEAAEEAEGIHHAEEPPTAADTWLVDMPFLFAQLTVTFEDFAGILLVRTTHSDDSMTIGIGVEMQGVIFWMEPSGALFFGNINRSAGTMWGIVFGYQGSSSVWFANHL